MKFLDIKNPEDFKTWEKICDLGHDANLHPCPYGLNFEFSKSCRYNESEDDPSICYYGVYSGHKARCELLPIKEKK